MREFDQPDDQWEGTFSACHVFLHNKDPGTVEE